MRQKHALPGFLSLVFAHALAHRSGKGGGGGGSSTPTQPAYTPPPSPTSAVNYDVARTYFEGNYKGTNTPYTDPWNDEFNAWTSGLESTWGVDSYEKLNYGQLTGQITPPSADDPTGTDEPPAPPPAPDAPVTAPNGTLISAPTPATPIPPVSDRSSEVAQAGRDARRQSRKRKGLLSTFLAGETGGAKAPVKTLLGQ